MLRYLQYDGKTKQKNIYVSAWTLSIVSHPVKYKKNYKGTVLFAHYQCANTWSLFYHNVCVKENPDFLHINQRTQTIKMKNRQQNCLGNGLGEWPGPRKKNHGHCVFLRFWPCVYGQTNVGGPADV
jgi:hypothetical protein